MKVGIGFVVLFFILLPAMLADILVFLFVKNASYDISGKAVSFVGDFFFG